MIEYFIYDKYGYKIPCEVFFYCKEAYFLKTFSPFLLN